MQYNRKTVQYFYFPDTGSHVATPPYQVDPGGPVVIILASGPEVRGLDPGQGQWIFSERKNPEYYFLRKGSKAVGLVLKIHST